MHGIVIQEAFVVAMDAITSKSTYHYRFLWSDSQLLVYFLCQSGMSVCCVYTTLVFTQESREIAVPAIVFFHYHFMADTDSYWQQFGIR